MKHTTENPILKDAKCPTDDVTSAETIGIDSERETNTKGIGKRIRNSFWRWRQRLKCRFGWHRPRVWGHVEDPPEYYYNCEVCKDDGFWAPPSDYNPDLGKMSPYVPLQEIKP